MDALQDYRNGLFNRDTMSLLSELPDNSLDMIYGDPDYGVGVNYAGKKYTKQWDEYIEWYENLAKECMRVLKPTGNLFFINYPKQNAYLRVKCLDEIAYDVHDYVWIFNTNIGHTKRRFTTAHRSIIHARKSKDNNFYKDNVAEPYQNPTDKRIRKRVQDGAKGRMPYSWLWQSSDKVIEIGSPNEIDTMKKAAEHGMPYSWHYHNLVKNVSKDKTFHSCQIPLDLVEKLIKASTQEGDDCFILFGGSGSEIILCKQLKRNFISCEIHSAYHGMILDRLANAGHIKEKYRLMFRQKANS